MDPSSVSFLWISILFAILWVGYRFGQDAGNNLQGDATGAEYFRIAGQALVAGKYRKARPYSVEAMLLYAQCKYMQREDPHADAWVMMGLATRLAQRMGYHRDPCYLKNITPFEGEMRRRTWALLGTFDTMFSFQAGLPAIINEADCDVEPPRNLFDEDFGEDCIAVPPSRPPTDPTPMLYYCYKGRFSITLKRVIRHTLSLQCPPYELTMELDRQLDKEHADIPPSLQWKPLGTSFTDHATQIVNRLHIEVTCLKSRAILHRKYLSYQRSNPVYDFSRKTAIDAALKILSIQAELYIATQPGGRFHNDKWLFSSLMLHDFLLAAMIACLDLYESYRKPAASTQSDLDTRVQEYEAICQSHEVWTSRKAISRDARRASNVLAALLSKVPRPDSPATGQHGNWEPSDVPTNVSNGVDPQDSIFTFESSPWFIDSASMPDQGLTAAIPDFDFESSDPLNSVFGQSDFIDWVSKLPLAL